MSQLAYLVTYLAIAVFLAAVTKRIVGYLRNPLHLRWELYPVAHEGKRAAHGGGYLEDVDWWKKPREVSRIGELKVMIPEILFLKAVWEYKRPLWYVTYPFHLGLYFCAAFIGLLGAGAVLELLGLSAQAPLLSAVAALTNVAGPAGFVLAFAGAAGLLYKRVADPELRDYSSFEHYFNLMLFLATLGVAILCWLFADPTFAATRSFVAGLISFRMTPVASPLLLMEVLLAALTVAYIPLTHMSHFFMKYFLYHDIRWGDAPNVNAPRTAAQIGTVLNYPVTWSAPHIQGDGKKTWAEVATFIPAAETDAGKE